MKKLVSIIASALFVVASSSSKCYSTIPFEKTPLYKYLTEKTDEKVKFYEKKSLEQSLAKEQKKIEKQYKKEITEEKMQVKRIYPLEPTKSNEEQANIISNNQVYKQLFKSPDLSALHPKMTFEEAIDVFRNSTSPPLNIIVLWKDTEENSDVTRNTTIEMEAITGVPLKKNLEILLQSISSDQKSLGYIVDEGVITIGTQNTIKKQDFLSNKIATTRITRVYDISDLIGQPANYFTPPRTLMGGYGMRGYGGYGGYRGIGYGSMPYGSRGYGGYGMPYGNYGGYGIPSGGYYGNYGQGYYRGGYRTNVGRIQTGTSLNVSPNIMGNYVSPYNRGQELVELIERHAVRRR